MADADELQAGMAAVSLHPEDGTPSVMPAVESNVVVAPSASVASVGAGAAAPGSAPAVLATAVRRTGAPLVGDVAALRGKEKDIAIAMGLSDPAEAEAADAKHRFWTTQPVRKFAEQPDPTVNGPIEPDTPLAEVRAEPYGLPAGFEWCSLDVRDASVLTELHDLLAHNYVEDDDAMFRFAYSRDFLTWALTPPGFYPEWHVGVRVSKSRKLVASITGVPAELRVYASPTKRMCEINFLCVDKKLRSKRLAPVLIREVTRRVHLRGIFQAAYTAGVVLPRPVASARYWHRSIDPKKLIEVGFSALAPRMTMARTIRQYQLPKVPTTSGLRPMLPGDVPSACALLNGYLSTFALHPEFSEADFGHWLLPRPGVVDTFVLPHPTTGRVTDMLSFYHLPSTVIGNAKHTTLAAAYLYYYAPGSVPLPVLLEDALVLAGTRGVDVVNCLDLMDNAPYLRNLKFQPGDGSLQYYLYNWACPQTDPASLGLVLL